MNGIPLHPRSHRNGIETDMVKVAAVETLYRDSTLSLRAIGETVGVAPHTIERWQVKYGWTKREYVPRKPRATQERETHTPTVWRCPCDPRQLHKAGEACQCGHVPPWAEAS